MKQSGEERNVVLVSGVAVRCTLTAAAGGAGEAEQMLYKAKTVPLPLPGAAQEYRYHPASRLDAEEEL